MNTTQNFVKISRGRFTTLHTAGSNDELLISIFTVLSHTHNEDKGCGDRTCAVCIRANNKSHCCVHTHTTPQHDYINISVLAQWTPHVWPLACTRSFRHTQASNDTALPAHVVWKHQCHCQKKVFVVTKGWMMLWPELFPLSQQDKAKQPVSLKLASSGPILCLWNELVPERPGSKLCDPVPQSPGEI